MKEKTRWWKGIQKIKCELCGQFFRRVTNTHLWKDHQISIEEYKELYPGVSIDAPDLAYTRVSHLRGKTYEEVYGIKKSKDLISTRKKDALVQMKDQDQIEVRKKKCGGDLMTLEQKKDQRELHTIHGTSNYRERALEYYGLECQRCGKATENPDDFSVHHKDLVNIGSELGNHNVENLMVLCNSCHARLHNELGKATGRFVGLSHIERGVHYILLGLKNEYGLDLKDVNFRDTPKRVARAYAEMFDGIRNTKEQVKEILSSAFPSEYNGLVIARDVRVFSMCPHHLLPVDYNVSVGYIPSPDGKVLGVSKLSRLIQVLAGRPVLQEQLGEDIVQSLMSLTGCIGAGCNIEGKHYCMIMRGVRQVNSVVGTSSLKGLFLENSSAGVAVRNELMALWRKP